MKTESGTSVYAKTKKDLRIRIKPLLLIRNSRFMRVEIVATSPNGVSRIATLPIKAGNEKLYGLSSRRVLWKAKETHSFVAFQMITGEKSSTAIAAAM